MPDVAEVEHRRVGDHVGVLEARDEPGAVDDARMVTNGLATATSMKLKKVAIPPITGTTQVTTSRSSRRFSVTASAA